MPQSESDLIDENQHKISSAANARRWCGDVDRKFYKLAAA